MHSASVHNKWERDYLKKNKWEEGWHSILLSAHTRYFS
jgi:hypothetical protein